MATDPATMALVAALRQGRGVARQGEANLYAGGGQDLSALFSRQGLTGQQPGLAAALAEQGRQRGQYAGLEGSSYERGLGRIGSESALNTAGMESATGDLLNQLRQQGTDSERMLRNTIGKIRANQRQDQLLTNLLTAIGGGAAVGGPAGAAAGAGVGAGQYLLGL